MVLIDQSASQSEAMQGGVAPVDLFQEEPNMPSLQHMHRLVARNPRAQAKFFLLASDLFFQLLGLGTVRIGKLTLCKSGMHADAKEDEYASSLRPGIGGTLVAGQGTGEAQARGFRHTHFKGYGFQAVDLAVLRRALLLSPESGKQLLSHIREQCVAALTSSMYVSAVESGRQLGVPLPPVPDTKS